MSPKSKPATLSVNVVVVTRLGNINDEPRVLLIGTILPMVGRKFALPGDLLGETETTLAAAVRVLKEQFCVEVDPSQLKQLPVLDDPQRTFYIPGREISIVYRVDFEQVPPLSFQNKNPRKTWDWHVISRLTRTEMCFDHWLVIQPLQQDTPT